MGAHTRTMLKLLLSCALLASGTAAAAPAKTLTEAAEKNHLKMMLTAVNQVPAAARLFDDPKAKCTVLAPTDQGYRASLQMLGSKVGLVAQNRTMMAALVEYHILPEALTAKQLRGTSRVLTMNNETMFLHTDKASRLWVYSNYRLPVMVQTTDIRAGNCYMHILNRTIVPPSLLNTLEGYSQSTGNFPTLPPKGEWAPEQEPLAGTPKPVSVLDGSAASPAAAAPAAAAGAAAPGDKKASGAAQHKVLHALAGAAALGAMLLL